MDTTSDRSSIAPGGRARARDLGIRIRRFSGLWNAITDVPDIRVGDPYRVVMECFSYGSMTRTTIS